MSKKEMPVEATVPESDAEKLEVMRSLVTRAGEGDSRALAELRAKLASAPAAWQLFGNLASQAQHAWIRISAGSNPFMEEAIHQTSVALRTELLGAAPSPLERLLVERIVACWLQVQYADRQAATFEQTGGRFAQGEYWQRQQDRTHHRYLSAIRALAQVRRLLIPTMQVNIAEQQLNVVH